jgi:hypothetical protein
MQFMLNVCAKPGHAFAPVAQAKTIRGRDGDLQIIDGPVSKAAEPIAGFNLLECETLDEAVEVSAAHPMAKHGSLELRAIDA